MRSVKEGTGHRLWKIPGPLAVPGMTPTASFHDDLGEAGGQKEDGQDDGGVEEDLLDAALGPKDVAVPAESGAEARPLLLQEDDGDQQDGNGHLRDEQGVFHITKRNKRRRRCQRSTERRDYAMMWHMTARRGVSPTIVTVLTLLVLAAVLVFLWRVYGYYRQIRSGVVVLPQFSSSFSASGKLDGAVAGESPIATADDPAVGPAEAKLTIVEFLDYQCPFCNQEAPTVRELSSAYGDRVRFIIRDFPVVDIHPDAAYAAEAAGCAEEQGKFWQMHDRLFALKGQLKATDLEKAAEQSGLDLEKYKTCMQVRARVDEIEDDLRAGVKAGVRGTPTFFFNGEKVEGAIPKGVFEGLIKTYLDR